jgi:ElaA protein
VLHDRLLHQIEPAVLYRILQLRSEVFVVEQDCVFLDADGRDLEPGCRQLWIEEPDGRIVAVARILDEGDLRRIGRIVTATAVRRSGHGGRLIEHALETSEGPWALDAQARLAPWYASFGFEISGAEYIEDGIPHVPMLRSG